MPSSNTNDRSVDSAENSGACFVDMRTAIKDATRILRERHENGSGLYGLSTGLALLDDVLGGLKAKYLYVVASRPSMGRTTFVLNIVEHVTLACGKRAAVFSSRESTTSLTIRLFASIGRIEVSHLRTGDLTTDEWARLGDATARLASSNAIFVNDSTTLLLADLCNTARRLKEQHNIDVLVVDGLESVRIPGKRANGLAELREIARCLKAIAEELNIPVVATAMIGRSVEERDDRRPTMMDFDEPDAVDQHADVVLFIYRDEFYNQVADNERGIADIIVGRNRDADTFAIKLLFQSVYLRFEELF